MALILLLGAGLLGLTLYISILSYALRHFSRARLAERLPEAVQGVWLERLERHEHELQLLFSLLRLVCLLAVAVWACVFLHPGAAVDVSAATLAIPLGVAAALLLVAAVAVPHVVAVHAPEGVLAGNLRAVWGLRLALWPVARLLSGMEIVLRRLLGLQPATPEEASERVEQEVLEVVQEGELSGVFNVEQKEMIQSVFEFHATTVGEIMTPRTDIVAIPSDADYDLARRTIIEAGHSRIPVFEGTLDHIVGVLYAKDLLRLRPDQPFEATRMMRVAPFVPETKTLRDLLSEFRATKVQIAIVLDEYGGTAGLATIEDILEEIVGEIDDEYDQRKRPRILRLDDHTVEVDARAHVYDVNQALEIELPEDGDFDTIGGFVFSTLGRIPAAGEEFRHENLVFKVMSAEPRKINRLRISVLREAPTV